MVVHDRETEQRWADHRVAQEQKKKKAVVRTRRWSVLGVQSLACGAIVLLVLLLKLAGGGAYEELKQSFRGALADNQLMAMLSGLFEEETSEENDVKEYSFTDEETQQTQGFAALSDAALTLWWAHA